MKKAIIAALLLALAPAASYAGTLNFPSDAPAATITIPDDWKPEETDSGIQAESPDGAIYMSIDVAGAENVEKVIQDAITFLKDRGVTVDPASQKETDNELNGMPVKNFDWNGKDENGDVSIALSLVQPSEDKLLVLTYWGTQGDQDKHNDAIVAMLASLKPAQ
ncbi:histidine kinase [Gellertiella hungarica]|uniref:Histidine kinase n=1 Tax=Gellertiella hungarica TaxID=1572859 RepID=A0A7W6NKZ3_9HYPH|nr:histidine kinase [Gellertiella hungarica]MBB4065049.1 hypothetical protein [Gellertiella hungarica]